ncbi:peptidase inhibitor family I36 protein [Actinophytocola oryzae]|uniref:Peptidase inhibitor family I36 n=1 Tax=Actinophytocola oryzae TaxID=502181 RepID=A0A4R7VS64_9PSEU|nr:peptidase inhibitor family I36 protein [Actinophytocola oryzae]TDV52315.1 peptidase inhibitor family I36 [Actinophytocola oryzae]
MAAATRKAAMALAVPALLGGVFAGTATAEPGSGMSPAETRDFSNCPAGYACFYTGVDGTGKKCQYQSADTDHAECSWAAEEPVRSVYNHGTNAAYGGLCAYNRPDYSKEGAWTFVPRGQAGNIASTEFKVLSHRWTTGNSAASC